MIQLVLRVSFCLFTLFGVLWAKRKAKRIQNHMYKIIFVAYITASLAVFTIYPLTGGLMLDSLSKLGAYQWAWACTVAQFTMIQTLGTWWMRVVVATLQAGFFAVFLFQREPYHDSIFLTLFLYGFVFYVATLYLQERFNRLDFLEKREIYENYEAIKKIFNDISQGIMRVGQENEIIYANRAVHTIFNQDSQALSLAEISAQIYVKSVFPPFPMDILSTERGLLTQENAPVTF